MTKTPEKSRKNSIIAGRPNQVLDLFTIITADGRLKTARKGYAVLYKFLKHAMRGAKDDGDSIVRVSVALSKPVYIHTSERIQLELPLDVGEGDDE